MHSKSDGLTDCFAILTQICTDLSNSDKSTLSAQFSVNLRCRVTIHSGVSSNPACFIAIALRCQSVWIAALSLLRASVFSVRSCDAASLRSTHFGSADRWRSVRVGCQRECALVIRDNSRDTVGYCGLCLVVCSEKTNEIFFAKMKTYFKYFLQTEFGWNWRVE